MCSITTHNRNTPVTHAVTGRHKIETAGREAAAAAAVWVGGVATQGERVLIVLECGVTVQAIVIGSGSGGGGAMYRDRRGGRRGRGFAAAGDDVLTTARRRRRRRSRRLGQRRRRLWLRLCAGVIGMDGWLPITHGFVLGFRGSGVPIDVRMLVGLRLRLVVRIEVLVVADMLMMMLGGLEVTRCDGCAG